MVFDRNASLSDNTFSTSGKLLNSNLVMYDRLTESYWPQVLEMAVTGELKEEALKLIPSHWTNWMTIKENYPDARILSFDTGFSRDYKSDPYGSYFVENTYYTSDVIISPMMNKSERFFEKKIFTAVKGESKRLAIDNNTLKRIKLANLNIESAPILAIYDDILGSVRVFDRTIDGKELIFSFTDNQIVDQAGDAWLIVGEQLVRLSDQSKLQWRPSFDIMWFVWYAYYPNSEVYTDLK